MRFTAGKPLRRWRDTIIARSISATLDGESGLWTSQDLSESNFDRVVELAREGLTCTEIAGELEVNKSTVSRHLKKARAQGLVSGK